MSQTISEAARGHLALALTDGVGPIVFSRLMNQFGSAERILAAAPGALESVKSVGRETSAAIARARGSDQVDAEIDAAAQNGVRIICRADPEYPPGLKRIPDAPIVLFVKGDLRPADAVAIAVVGSRRCSIYGSEQARRFAELLAQAGFVIVSGLARGIDAFAHHGALDAGGRSIAVLGNGLAEIYPPENRTLAERMLGSGSWISELPMRTTVRATNFPSRNRIIAGMTLGTLVVEAAARSGALITARLASDYNREVFAVPGRVQDAMSIGTNGLIRDGVAKLVTSLEDMLDELGEVGAAMKKGQAVRSAADAAQPNNDPATGSQHDVDDSPSSQLGSPDGDSLFDAAKRSASSDEGAAAAQQRVASLSPVEQRVFALIGIDPILQDVIISASELPVGEVLAAFTSLELKALVKRLPGQLIVRRGLA